MRHVITLLLALMVGFIFSGCDKRKGDLTRELAKEILNQHLANQKIVRLEFREGGRNRAESDGVIERIDYGPIFRFTSKSLNIAGSYFDRNSKFFTIITLSDPINASVKEITGITDDAQPNAKIVEYTMRYNFPSQLQFLQPYVFTGEETKIILQKYDDGWRVSN